MRNGINFQLQSMKELALDFFSSENFSFLKEAVDYAQTKALFLNSTERSVPISLVGTGSSAQKLVSWGSSYAIDFLSEETQVQDKILKNMSNTHTPKDDKNKPVMMNVENFFEISGTKNDKKQGQSKDQPRAENLKKEDFWDDLLVLEDKPLKQEREKEKKEEAKAESLADINLHSLALQSKWAKKEANVQIELTDADRIHTNFVKLHLVPKTNGQDLNLADEEKTTEESWMENVGSDLAKSNLVGTPTLKEKGEGNETLNLANEKLEFSWQEEKEQVEGKKKEENLFFSEEEKINGEESTDPLIEKMAFVSSPHEKERGKNEQGLGESLALQKEELDLVGQPDWEEHNFSSPVEKEEKEFPSFPLEGLEQNFSTEEEKEKSNFAHSDLPMDSSSQPGVVFEEGVLESESQQEFQGGQGQNFAQTADEVRGSVQKKQIEDESFGDFLDLPLKKEFSKGEFSQGEFSQGEEKHLEKKVWAEKNTSEQEEKEKKAKQQTLTSEFSTPLPQETAISSQLVEILYRLKHPVFIELTPFHLTGEELVKITKGETLNLNIPKTIPAIIKIGDQKFAQVSLKLTNSGGFALKLEGILL